MIERETLARTVLTRTRIPGHDYCINPYVGCAHGCRYCYASFMKRFTGHDEPWGEFVDVKTNAPEVLRRQLRRARPGSILLGTVTDPYQPAEARHRITRRCLEALLDRPFHVNVLTRSPLCLRDADLLRRLDDVEVGLSIPTDREDVRRLFEPRAPPIPARVAAVRELRRQGIRTYAFLGPLLPLDPERLADALAGAVDEVLIDRLNYADRVKALYRSARLSEHLEDAWFERCASELTRLLGHRSIPATVLFAC